MFGLVALGDFGKLRGTNEDVAVEHQSCDWDYAEHYVKVKQILELFPLETRWPDGHVMVSMIIGHSAQLLLQCCELKSC